MNKLIKTKLLTVLAFSVITSAYSLNAALKQSPSKTATSTPASTSAAAAAIRPARILTADLQQVLIKYNRCQETNKRIEGMALTIRDEIEGKLTERNTLVEEYQKLQDKMNNPAVNADTRKDLDAQLTAKGKEIEEKSMRFAEFKQEADTRINKYARSAMDIHVYEVKEAANEIAQKRGADLVLNSKDFNSVIYANGDFDITDQLIESLNAKSDDSATPSA